MKRLSLVQFVKKVLPMASERRSLSTLCESTKIAASNGLFLNVKSAYIGGEGGERG